MKEVTKEEFNKVISDIPYNTSFLLGVVGIRYNGSGKKFKNQMFAKSENGKYYVLNTLSV